MADVETMTVPEPGDYLSEQPNGFFLWEWSMFRNIIEKFASFNVFKHEVPKASLLAPNP
jgi:hypothetical protein